MTEAVSRCGKLDGHEWLIPPMIKLQLRRVSMNIDLPLCKSWQNTRHEFVAHHTGQEISQYHPLVVPTNETLNVIERCIGAFLIADGIVEVQENSLKL